MLIDMLFGLILGYISNYLLGTPDSLNLALIFGIFCSLAPDIDFIIYLLKNKFRLDQFAHEHRDLFHKPLFFIISGILILLHSPELGAIWIIGTLYHHIHDTIDGGWGILWLYPFSKKYYTLVRYSPQRIFQNKKEQHKIAAQYGDPDWFQKELKVNTALILKIFLIFSLIIAILVI